MGHGDRSRGGSSRRGAVAGFFAGLAATWADATPGAAGGRRQRCSDARRCRRGACCPEGRVCADKKANLCVPKRGACPPSQDGCTAAAPCGAGAGQEPCRCARTTAGKTRCGYAPSGAPAPGPCACRDDDDCRRLYPDAPGAFCARTVVGAGGCEAACAGEAGGTCLRPCENPTPAAR